MQKTLLFFIANFICVTLFSQKLDWKSIDKDIAGKKNLVDLYQKIEAQKNYGTEIKDYGFVGRCLQTQLYITDLKKEDTSFFKNSSFIDSILNSNAAPILKSVMHIMQAKRLAYFQKNIFYRSNKNLYKNKVGFTNYCMLSTTALDSLIDYHTQQAVTISKQENVKYPIDYLWLSSDPLQFLFKPTYADIIIAEQISFTASKIPTYNFDDNSIWIEKSVPDFIKSMDTIKNKYTKINTVLQLYKNWANNNKTNNEAYYFIETLARKFLNNHSYQNTKTKEAYQAYLEQQIKSPYNPVKAYCVYQLCLNLNSLGNKYRAQYGNSYDTTYRYHFAKALKIFTQNESVLDSFTILKQVLQEMKGQILSSSVEINTNENYLPNEKVIFKTKYKNVKNIFVKIVRSNYSDNIYMSDSLRLEKLKKSTSVFEKKYEMPIVEDYQQHTSALNITNLGIGRYYILYSKDSMTSENKNVQHLKIEVTNIAVINNDSKVFVLNRTTGFPLEKSSVEIQHKNKLNLSVITKKNVNKEGFVIITEEKIEKLFAVFNGDTTQSYMNMQGNRNSDEIYDGEDMDDLMDYYKDNLQLNMFTDRSIYRPGQTVFYKGIITIRNPKNGEPLVLNKQNLKLPLLAKLFSNEAKELFNGGMELNIKNPFDKKVDTIKIKLNEYGSFTGTFKIPADAATGEWEFDSDDIYSIRNNTSFKVEEYKRPTFELSLEKPTINVKLGEDFIAKAKVKTFAGATLSNIKINYDVEARINYEKYDSTTKETNTVYFDKTILDSTGFTNDAGELDIKIINDSIRNLPLVSNKRYNVSYSMHAEAIDATGESHEEDMRIEVSNRPIAIQININRKIEKSEIEPIKITSKESFTTTTIDKKLDVKLYKIEKVETDVIVSDDDFIGVEGNWKYVNPTPQKETKDKEIIIQTSTLNTNTEKYNLPKEKLFAGEYKVVTTCTEENILLGESTKTFTIIDKDGALQTDEDENFYYLKNNTGNAGDKINWLVGNKAKDIYSIYHIAYYQKTKKGYSIKNEYDIKPEKKGVHNFSYTLPANIASRILLTHVYVQDGEIYKKEEKIFPTTITKETEIIVEQYRTILTPGSKEKFVVSVKTKNENIASEIATTMYDASLDKIEKHNWNLPKFETDFNIDNDWNTDLNNNLRSELPWNFYWIRGNISSKREAPLYWLNPMDYVYSELKPRATYSDDFNYKNGDDVMGDWNRIPSADGYLMGRVPGVSIMNTAGLDEVVVTGLSSTKSYKMTGSTSYSVVLRGISSLDVSNKPLVVLDGVVYAWSLDKIDANSITEAMVLKGADATALYGAQGANGVIILSTKGSIVLPKPEAPPVVVRKNFSETVFFFPQVHADKDGFYNFNFTLPESVTEWKWKILSHTKNAIFSMAEKTIFTQLPLMVQPNMPRFLYQGDKIILQSRITNLDTVNINGNSFCTIEDAVTGENITAQLAKINTQKFEVAKKSNSTVPFTISIPENFLHPIKIKVSASTNNFSDGEEYTIPIMSKKILVAQPQQFVFSNKDTSINTPTLPADATVYGISMHIKPKPQAALLHALPYLAFYQFNCAEQTFNKMLAHSLGVYLMRKDTSLQKMQKIKLATENKTEALPLELSEQTMPWLQLNNSVAKHQKDLSTLLDTLRSNELIKKYFEDVYALQNNDGGMAWFKEGKSDPYISNYILQGFGKLKKDKLYFIAEKQKEKYNGFIKNLTSYCDEQFLDSTRLYTNSENITYINARKYHVTDFALTENVITKIEKAIAQCWKNADTYNIGMQAALIQASMFYGNAKNNFSNLAKAKLESIKQLANTDDAAGVRWKELSNRDDLSTSNEEAVVAIAEAFEAAGNDKETIDGIIKWLLYTKDNHNWSSTKSTADVVTLLNRNPNNVPNNAINITANFDRATLSITDNLLKGNLSAFAQSAIPAKINLNKDVADIAIGNLNYYYFTATPPTNENASGVKITKQLYRINNDKEELVNENTILNIADKIKTIITIENAKQLKYVFIDEKRAAGLEPKDAISSYEYSKGFSYYQSVRDAGYQFFAEQIPSGIHTIIYYTTVAKEGIFYNGVVALQCMYSPSVKAYGSGNVIQVVK
jgi:alpha-2-macroglobulin